MNANTLTGMVCGTVVVVVLLAAMLMPAISEAQLTAGSSVTYENTQTDGNCYMRAIQDGDTLVVTTDGTNNGVVELNGTQITTIAGSTTITYHTLIFSDVYCLWLGGATGSPAATHYGATGQTTVPYGECKVEYSDGVITETYTETDSTVSTYTWEDATWGFICCNESEAEYFESVRSGSTAFYTTGVNDVVCSGVYTTGDLDTFYAYYNGTNTCNEGYTMSTDLDMTLVEGTTDIYSTTIEVSISDGTDTESFVPYRIMIPLEVTGHADSGGMYSVYGVIPIILVVSLVIGAISMIATGRRD